MDVVVRRRLHLPWRPAGGRVARWIFPSAACCRRCSMPWTPQDPRALRARRDLQRVHRAMRTVTVLARAVGKLRLARTPRRILELGGGDGTLMLRFARGHPHWSPVELTVLDTQDLVSAQTRAAYRSLGWDVRVLTAGRLAVGQRRPAPRAMICALTNLFLHHFNEPELTRLLFAIARDCDALVACEPRRSVCLAARQPGHRPAGHELRHAPGRRHQRGRRVSRTASSRKLWPADLRRLVHARSTRRFPSRIALSPRRTALRRRRWRREQRRRSRSLVADLPALRPRCGLPMRAGALCWRNNSTFPRQKVCGECLPAGAFALLDELGVGEQVRHLAGPELRRVGWMDSRRTLVTDMPACVATARVLWPGDRPRCAGLRC